VVDPKTPCICPVCEQPLDLCEELQDKVILACNNEACWSQFVYIYREEWAKPTGDQYELELDSNGS